MCTDEEPCEVIRLSNSSNPLPVFPNPNSKNRREGNGHPVQVEPVDTEETEEERVQKAREKLVADYVEYVKTKTPCPQCGKIHS